MIGTIWWNVIAGCVLFVSTFLMSVGDNLLLTSLLKGLYSFAIMFALMFFLRFVLGFVLHQSPGTMDLPDEMNEKADLSVVGRHLDLTTPNDPADLNPSAEAAFTPFEPPKIESKPEIDEEALVRAVRHLTGDEGG